ncbi:LOW QUALITY PROTEIN: alpha-catulin [Metopolophium dirhodum]|uniref:LOW QUALITY PROTEIN: alpha-catulin n=1 Tax=Metopolophium dirhodum TaxID=44670 RepID=UPI00298F5349|nr:LOW QUALITY PROTEIN: alpha-catulin [Metopolophium dirhodum]
MAKSPAATPSSNAPPSPLSPPIVTVAAAASHCTSPSAAAGSAARHRQPEWPATSPAASPSSGGDAGSTSSGSGSGSGGGRGQSYHYDGGAEITLKSIEHTLLPLVKQISTLVAHRERPFCTERTARAIARVGQGVNLAIERFVTVGETIADDNPEIKSDMYLECKEARAAGASIEKLCEAVFEDSINDRASVIRAARCLLSSVTRVLLLADVVVVKQLISVKDKVSRSLGRLEGVNNFTEFVKAFSHFGTEMVELAHLTGERQNDLKDERRRSQIAAARQVLERSTMLLLTSSKACLRHPDSSEASQNRDTVFCQMRRAMDLIHYVVKDGVKESGGESMALTPYTSEQDGGDTLGHALNVLDSFVDMTRLTLVLSEKETLLRTMDVIMERTQDFTDSAYTRHEHRENILTLCDRVKTHLDQLIRAGARLEQCDEYSPTKSLEVAVNQCLDATKELRLQLIATCKEQSHDLPLIIRTGYDLVTCIQTTSSDGDVDSLNKYGDQFVEVVDQIGEICKVLRHIATAESLQVSAKHAEVNLRVYAPQIVTAAQALAHYPCSKIIKENLEVFADMWQALTQDVSTVCKEIMEKQIPEKQTYMSLPRPGKHGTTTKPLKSVRLDLSEQDQIAKAGLEMKLASSEVDTEADRWGAGEEDDAAIEEGASVDERGNATKAHEDNDIVRRAKNMSGMALSMYEFTKGDGGSSLRTTQDLFTQAEYLAEEANRLYKLVRQFSYQVPMGANKKELLEQLDQVPTYVQQLQFTVKMPTVGKSATFSKVDSVINETKTLMNVISKVVTTCFVCATKYNLDFQGLSARSGGFGERGEDGSGAGSGGEGGKLSGGSGSDGSM